MVALVLALIGAPLLAQSEPPVCPAPPLSEQAVVRAFRAWPLAAPFASLDVDVTLDGCAWLPEVAEVQLRLRDRGARATRRTLRLPLRIHPVTGAPLDEPPQRQRVDRLARFAAGLDARLAGDALAGPWLRLYADVSRVVDIDPAEPRWCATLMPGRAVAAPAAVAPGTAGLVWCEDGLHRVMVDRWSPELPALAELQRWLAQTQPPAAPLITATLSPTQGGLSADGELQLPDGVRSFGAFRGPGGWGAGP